MSEKLFPNQVTTLQNQNTRIQNDKEHWSVPEQQTT